MSKPERPTVGQEQIFSIYGHRVLCRVIKVYSFGTVDVERLSDGECFRLTGLGWA